MGGREGGREVGAENSLFLSRSHSSYGTHLLNLTNQPTVTEREARAPEGEEEEDSKFRRR